MDCGMHTNSVSHDLTHDTLGIRITANKRKAFKQPINEYQI
jgi:hypothetical protein